MAVIEVLESRVLLSALPPVTNVSLDGTWELQRTNTADVAGLGTSWTNVEVPSLMSWNDQRYAWYRTDVNVASDWADGHVFVSFGAVRYVSDVYVNGVHVGGHFGGWESFDVDITDYVTPGGTDQLLVRVQDLRGVLIDPNVPYTPNSTPADENGSNILAPVGSQERLFGIWEPVELEYRRDVYIQDVAVTTSYRDHTIAAEYTLRNLDTVDRTVSLDGLVNDLGTSVLNLGTTTITVPAGGTLSVTLSQPWSNPKLWMPDSPNLYFLESHLSDSTDDLDADITRFGFREFWIQGTQFVLNGTPITFLATAGHPDWSGRLLSDEEIRQKLEDVRGANVMAMRLHANIWPSNWYKVADEIGMPIILESALWCYSGAYALDQPAFWQNARDHFAGVIADHRNHPSVVMYSIENEILHVGGSRVPETEVNLGDLGRYVKSLDPTRPIMYDGDEDPDGAADVINLHYPWEFPDHVDYPNMADWLDGPKVVQGWPYQLWEWDRTKPLYMGEFLWMFQQSDAAYTGLLGDSAYEDNATARAKAAAWEFQIEAYRKAGLAGMCPWTLWESGEFPNVQYDVIQRAFEPNAAIVDEYDRRFFANEAVTRTVQLYNDTLYDANLTLEWWLDGAKQGESTFSMTPAGHIQTQITLNMPSVADVTDVNFQLIVRNGSNVVYTRDRSYQVFPTTAGQLNLPVGTRIAVFAGDGTADQFLQQSGITPLTLSDLADVNSLDPDLLIIDAHALDAYSLGSLPTVGGGVAAELQNFMRSGGTVLVLEQDALPKGLFPVQIEAAPTTIGFVRESTHPALQGLRDDAMQFWRGDNYVADNIIQKPDTGGYRILADAGDRTGLDRVLVLELLQGRGRCILSQALISQKLGNEPMAADLMKRLIEYGATQATEQRATVGIVDADGSIATDLDAQGVDYLDLTGNLATTDLSGLSLLLVDGTSSEIVAAQATLKSFVQNGGTVILHGADAAAMANLGSTVPGDLTVIPSHTAPVLMTNVADPLSAGMMNENLHWLASLSSQWNVRHPLSMDVLLGSVTRTPPAIADCLVIENSAMTPPPPGTGNIFGGETLLWTNASIEAAITLDADGDYYFGILGHGTQAYGVYPSVSVYLDEQFVGSVSVLEASNAYGFMTHATAGTHTLRLAFTNDVVDSSTGDDRNVWIDKFLYAPMAAGPEVTFMQPGGLVKVDDGAGMWVLDEVNWDGRVGVQALPSRYLASLLDNVDALFKVDDSITIPAADFEQFAGGTAWSLGSDGVLGIWADATFGHDVHFVRSGTYRITMDIRGNLAGGEYGMGQLQVDGTAVGTSTPIDDNWARVSFDVTLAAGVHQVAVRFINDFYDPTAGEDRNIWVRKFQLRPLALDNLAPTDISLSNATVPENSPAGTVVGVLSGTDPDVGQSDTLSFSLPDGVGDNALFTIDPATNELKTIGTFDFEQQSTYTITVRATDTGSPAMSHDESFTISVSDVADATIAGRFVFYNRSFFDGSNPAANASDDAAIATDKQALLLNQTAAFSNYTSYSRGLNGIMIDIFGLAGDGSLLSASDFAFRTGNSSDLTSWTTAPSPLTISVRPGEGVGGSDRVTLIWADNNLDSVVDANEAVAKAWLQITVLAHAATTGLADPDIFYFGNAVGESGNSSSNAIVNATDELGARKNPRGISNRAPIDFAWDYNRDGLVNATDQLIARSNPTGVSTALRLIVGSDPADPATIRPRPHAGTQAVVLPGGSLWSSGGKSLFSSTRIDGLGTSDTLETVEALL